MIAAQPSFQDILAAAKLIAPYIHRTPCHPAPLLSARLGIEVWIKFENHHGNLTWSMLQQITSQF